MEGLIPFVYRAIVQYKSAGGQAAMAAAAGSWFNESPSFSYKRLPGDSGRFQSSETQLFRPDCSPAQLLVSTTAHQSPLGHTTSQRLDYKLVM